MGQVGQGENCELWIRHKLQACASGGIINKNNKTFAKYINIITNIPYKIKQSKTKNYMDYYIDHIYFSKQQKIIIQNDIKDYL